MDKENTKTYSEVKEVTRVISSKEEAIEAIAELIDNASLNGEQIGRCVLTYIDRFVKDESKIHATVMVIDSLADAFPQEVELKLFVNGEETSIDSFVTGGSMTSVLDKLKSLLGDKNGNS